jgi:hypothetical protein
LCPGVDQLANVRCTTDDVTEIACHGSRWRLFGTGRPLRKARIVNSPGSVARRAPRTIAISKLDRLARNVAFVSNLMEAGVEFVAVDFPQANRLTVHILAAVAEHEAAMISACTKAALEAAKARGVRLVLEKVNPVDPDGRTFAECIAETMVKMAIKGNVQAAVEICDRVEGKIKLSIGTVEDDEFAEKSIEELERELEQSGAGRLSEESDTGTPVISAEPLADRFPP